MKDKIKEAGGILLIVALAAVVFSVGQSKTKENVCYKDLFAMDTYFSMKVYGEQGEEALLLCEEKIQEFEAAWSVTDKDSEVSRLNSLGSTAVSEATFQLVQKALLLCRETEGALDITLYPLQKAWGFTTGNYAVPRERQIQMLLDKADYRGIVMEEQNAAITLPEGVEIDLGAVAKGYTGDCLLAILKDEKVTSAMLDLGGNVQVLGSKPDNTPWKVAVRNPLDSSRMVGVLEVRDKAVITSGSYERYFELNGERYWHILDPADGYPADNGLISVTVVGDSGVRCDGLSTALFVMGKEKACDFWREAGDFEMILITEEGELYFTEGLQECFVCTDGWTGEVIYRECVGD